MPQPIDLTVLPNLPADSHTRAKAREGLHRLDPLEVGAGTVPGDLPRPRLLVSVRSLPEMERAIAAGAEIVDFKEPRAGALAPAEPRLWQQAVARCQSLGEHSPPPPLSAALGEWPQAKECAGHVPERFAYAKAGPSGCGTDRQLRRLWFDVRDRLHQGVELVAVAYADWERADCLSPQAIFEMASECGLRRCLLDTFRKDGRSSIELLGWPSLLALQDIAKRRGLWWALAGSIRRDVLVPLREHQVTPDCFAVRGDVCRGTRQGRLQSELVRRWRDALRRPSQSDLQLP